MSAPLKKYPAESRTVVVDFAGKLAGSDILIGAPTVTVSDPALTATNAAVSGATVTVRIAGGVLGTSYTVTVIVGTSNGDTLKITRSVEVMGDAN